MDEEIREIEDKIKILKEEKQKIKDKPKIVKKKIEINTSPNILRRMSTKFYEKMYFIDIKRCESGLEPLSLPEKTELVVRHKDWLNIQEDIINFNKKLESNGGIPNVYA